MSFFSRISGVSRSPSAYVNQETQQSELERLRGRQLASLVRAGGRAKNHAQTTFEVAVTETQRGPLMVVVTLPQGFPMRAPHVQASMPVQHPWLDANGNVQSHPDLNQWTAHSDLGRIVSEIVAELRRQAATLQAAVQNQNQTQIPQTHQQLQPAISVSVGSTQSPLYPPSYAQYPSSSTPPPPSPSLPKKEPPQLQRSQMPVIPAIFPELEELSISQLENLSNDRHALQAFVHKIDSVKEFLRLRDAVMNGNIAIADKTLSYETQLREVQDDVHGLRERLQTAQTALAEKQARQQRVVARHRPDALLEQLSAATRAVDESSDDTASRFTHGEIDYATFVSEYLGPRTLYHQRTLKLNRVLQN